MQCPHAHTHARAALYNITHIHSRHIALRTLNTVYRRAVLNGSIEHIQLAERMYTGTCFVYYDLPYRKYVFIRLSTNGMFYFIHERSSVDIQLG